MKEFSEAERKALRLRSAPLEQLPDDRRDPLGGGDADEARLNQALFRVRRKAAAGAYNGTASRSLPLVALVAQVGVGAPLCAGLLYCYALNQQADAGVASAVEAIGASDAWLGGAFGIVWGKPPGGPLCLLFCMANGLNALRCASLRLEPAAPLQPHVLQAAAPWYVYIAYACASGAGLQAAAPCAPGCSPMTYIAMHVPQARRCSSIGCSCRDCQGRRRTAAREGAASLIEV